MRLMLSLLAGVALTGLVACGPASTTEARALVANAHDQGGEWFVQTGNVVRTPIRVCRGESVDRGAFARAAWRRGAAFSAPWGIVRAKERN